MGGRRLARLSDAFDLKVEHSFLEIHPETPPEGRPVSTLGYPPERWAQMMANLSRMGKDDGIVFIQRTFTANSHRALLLGEAAKDLAPGVFEAVSERIFWAYFSEGKNIGDPAVLREIAKEAGVPVETVDRAWNDPLYQERLDAQGETAVRLGITAVPTFAIGNKWIVEGAVPADMLRKVARKAAEAA